MGRSVQAVLEIHTERYSRLHFKPAGFVYRAFQAVAKPQSQGKVRTELPGIQEVSFVGLRGKISRTGRSRRQQSAVLAKREVGGILRKPADDRRGCVLYCRDAAPVQTIYPARQAVCRQEILE